jgi:hypothetical protein
MNKLLERIRQIKRYSDPVKEKRRVFKGIYRAVTSEINPYTEVSELATKRMEKKHELL